MRVVIAEDSVLLREGLVRLLQEYGADVVAAVGDGTSAVAAVREHRPDLAVLDVRMPPSFTDEGLVAALAIRSEQPGIAVLVLSQYVEQAQASELLAHGAGIGYLLKDHVTSLDDLTDALDRLLAGGTVLDPEVVSVLFTHRRQRDRVRDLTDREREVLALMAEGRSNAGIGRQLFITPGRRREAHRVDPEQARAGALVRRQPPHARGAGVARVRRALNFAGAGTGRVHRPRRTMPQDSQQDDQSAHDDEGQVSEVSGLDPAGPEEIDPSDATAGAPEGESGTTQEGTAGPNAAPRHDPPEPANESSR